ncbi:uncharacterized protein BO87DRAFT_391559 [Aspergillus neoniger CBS 115656]|uniref:Uncharacterized protein n=1 Tax=Aspergillus neoniger (strain CBS 115656) TaxID=1448310 RepID=A0A318Y7Z4_ASPNB|nr:hypothetical protein BO87DRAFT_391559 [Aspergillus neoniger CBS 115656]PYH28790.1 hypothetical protein BO87DRAFT_391559 [Aspergillus neoniger CBS 115656]
MLVGCLCLSPSSKSQAGSSYMAVSFKRLRLGDAHEGSGYSDYEDDDDHLSVDGGVFLEPGYTDEKSSTNKGKERVFTAKSYAGYGYLTYSSIIEGGNYDGGESASSGGARNKKQRRSEQARRISLA